MTNVEQKGISCILRIRSSSWVFLAAVVAYFVLFWPVSRVLGPGAVAVSFLPVLVGAIRFGWRGACFIVVGVLLVNLPATVMLFSEPVLDEWMPRIGLAHLIFLAIGFLLGLLSDALESNQKASKSRDQLIEDLNAFTRTLAHDLKTPLSQIYNLSEEALELLHSHPELKPNEVALVQQIRDTSGSLAKTTDSLLLLAHVEHRKVELEALDMESHFRVVEQRLAYQIREKGAVIHKPANWPIVLGYGPWIEEVWANLVSNALKYGGTPPVLEIRVAELPGRRVKYALADNGAGIPEDQRDKLFVEFERLGKHDSGGHGIGLAIVNRIIRRLNGAVGMTSPGLDGRGSCFYFILPKCEI